ncbi:hypothetical protein [Angustibacter aerolatus]|nr:hypothetical protein [Angustibacter aerolatus]
MSGRLGSDDASAAAGAAALDGARDGVLGLTRCLDAVVAAGRRAVLDPGEPGAAAFVRTVLEPQEQVVAAHLRALAAAVGTSAEQVAGARRTWLDAERSAADATGHGGTGPAHR